ncbi:hypothetical protein NADFUDRAFT_52801 [Nadsonia fulvescens var. elongata DSM 6958]|uniref:Uncharacterized protein n=1 Tax=Nadsonia fulvescens var. elongata DSM 6958 TaxID=857566 RepID=A0A1E3PES3_9ASCO|nr:hypothetical protein NADFUDRAFT_52801 [Nadsonia fulvescens var. elongata DSM 6958]
MQSSLALTRRSSQSRLLQRLPKVKYYTPRPRSRQSQSPTPVASPVFQSATTIPPSYQNPFAGIKRLDSSLNKVLRSQEAILEIGEVESPLDDRFFAKLVAHNPAYLRHFEPFLTSRLFSDIRQNPFVLEKLYAYVSYGHSQGYIMLDPMASGLSTQVQLWKWSKSNTVYTTYIELLREIHEEQISCSEEDLKMISNLLVNCN